MKTAVVTGASGFIGKAFTQYLLAQGYKVMAVVRNAAKMADVKHDNLLIRELDFSDYNLLVNKVGQADIFYHLAWDGAYGPKTADYNVQLNNIQAACCALLQAAAMGCSKFVLAGTIAELEVREHLDKNVCTPRSTCIYAAAKLSAEFMCKVLARENNIQFNCGLFANIIGPGDFSRRSTNSILGCFLQGHAPKLVKGDGLNDWLYIKDAVRLIEAMGNSGQNMKTYYIGHRKLWPLKQIISRARDVVAPEIELYFGEIPDSFLTDYNYISTTALYEDTGCKADYDFDLAIKETAEWVQKLQTNNSSGGGILNT